MARIADPKPVVCSVCLQPPMVRDNELVYVDFEVFYDGPVVTRYGERAQDGQTVAHPVDDMIICEECLRAGAALIGLADSERAEEELLRLNARIAELEKEIAAKDKAVADLEFSMGVAIDYPVKRPARPPRVMGPKSHDDEVKRLRSTKRKADKISKTMKKEKASA
jgi:hypothetical protein